ncbi:MAG: hypothetical protein HC877_22480 [Thioploca sp.]|nr:hypothetical protein [Thioploca sp.]
MKSCRPGSAYELEGKHGILSFNFKEIDADSATVLFRRRSGNGIVLLTSGRNSINCNIMSKVRQSVSITLDSSGELNIKRTQRSNGSLDVLSIELYTSKIEEIINWSSILRKCESYTCLRQIENKLLATEGGFIKAGEIISIETDPPNMFKRDGGDCIRFLGSCVIKSLDVTGRPKSKVPDLPTHREISPPLIQPIEKSNDIILTEPIRPVNKPIIPIKQEEGNSRLLFDTATGGFTKSFANNDTQVFPKHAILGHRGEYRIPVRFVKSYKDYILMVEASNIKGNGKFTATLAPSNDEKNRPLITLHHKQIFTKNLTAVGNPEQYEIVISRHPGSTGNVMITRIMFLEDIVNRVSVQDIMQSYLIEGKISNNAGNVPNVSDPILLKSLKYARHMNTWISMIKHI